MKITYYLSIPLVLVWAMFMLALSFSPAVGNSAEVTEVTGETGKPLAVGLVSERPKSGRYVETSRGFMVEYSHTVPGTDVEIRMIPVAGGKFTMGSPRTEQHRVLDEGPLRGIEIEPFWIGKHEVTWGAFRPYMQMYDAFTEFEWKKLRKVTDENTADAVTAPTPIYDPSYRYQYGRDANLPAASMSQFAARQYSKWLSRQCKQFYRLPTEAEWEYACRAGTRTAYCFGDRNRELAQYAVFEGDGRGGKDGPKKVGSRKPNDWGLHDMHGNVAEWVIDQHSRSYKKIQKRYMSVAEAINWPEKINPRVARGGGCFSTAVECRSAARLKSTLEMWSNDANFPESPWWLCGDDVSLAIGFRLIRPLDTPPNELKERFWGIDCDELRDNVETRLNEGRGKLGLVDERLIEAVKRLEDNDNK